jgi:stage V sporulation protein G
MIITEVRIKLTEDAADRLRAFCSITFDNCFVVRDLKIIEGNNGPFVAMPSRKIMSQCHHCGTKNHLRAKHCNQCGARLQAATAAGADAKSKLYADIAHPINAECREMIQSRVLREFEMETERSKLPGYVSRYDEEYGNIDAPPSRSASEAFRRTDPERPRDDRLLAPPHTGGPPKDAAAPPSSSQAGEGPRPPDSDA